jgi:CDP-diacylglycerol--glycerol-3-phosphate 3-phosphatidyltransferase
MLDRRWRAKAEQGVQPIARGLRSAGLSADGLTVVGLLFSAVTAVLVGQGRFGWATVALIAASLPDVFDGAVAKASGTAGPRGAFFDSVADRVSDALVLGGAAWWFAGTSEPRLAVLALAVLALTMVISYERARAESLGFDARGGLMERAERVVLLAVGLAFSLLEPVLWVMLALSALTVGQRFVKVWRQAAPMREHTRPVRFMERPQVRRITEWWPTRRAAFLAGEAGPGRRRGKGTRATARRTRP